MARRFGYAATAVFIAMIAVSVPVASAAVPPPVVKPVAYVPSIVSIPINPRWGRQIEYVIDIRSHAGVTRKLSIGFLLYLAAPTGQVNTQLGVYHRTITVPGSGTSTLRFTTTAPTQAANRELCLGVTIAGNSSGAFVCVPVTF